MTGQKKGFSSLFAKLLTLLTVLGILIQFFSFVTGIPSLPEIVSHAINYVNNEPKSNLEVSVINEPPTKLSKSSSIIYEFNICNNGKTGEEYNYSLERNNIITYTNTEEVEGFLNDGEKCVEVQYDLHPASQSFYPDIDFSIKVYSKSLNTLLFDETYKYSLNDEGYYELK